mmetsp:Transcript_5051/g.7867  ORF Transcript_5051/g.7867 Transcript_5051/m.7867 type:complete len:88 (+) Transcript_5051:127-390(+)
MLLTNFAGAAYSACFSIVCFSLFVGSFGSGDEIAAILETPSVEMNEPAQCMRPPPLAKLAAVAGLGLVAGGTLTVAHPLTSALLASL